MTRPLPPALQTRRRLILSPQQGAPALRLEEPVAKIFVNGAVLHFALTEAL